MNHIVIVGAGYAGVHAAKTLEKRLRGRRDVAVTLVNRDRFHVLMTSLHEIAGGRVDKQAVRIPLHDLFASGIVRLVTDTVEEVDYQGKTLRLASHPPISFDYLILATGSRPNYFGIEGAAEHAMPLWSLADALAVRRMVSGRFEQAAQCADPARRRELLSFLVAGGGFTGAELAGELARWCPRLCAHYGLDRGEVSLTLIEAMSAILPNLGPQAGSQAAAKLERMGVKVLTGAKIVKVEENAACLADGARLPGRLVWTAGIEGNPVNAGPLPLNNRGRFQVDGCMCAGGCVFAAGDAQTYAENGKPLPQMVEAAEQTGAAAALNVLHAIDKGAQTPLRTHLHGCVVSLGNRDGVARVMGMKLSGWPASMMKHLINVRYFLQLGDLEMVFTYFRHEFRTPTYSIPEPQYTLTERTGCSHEQAGVPQCAL